MCITPSVGAVSTVDRTLAWGYDSECIAGFGRMWGDIGVFGFFFGFYYVLGVTVVTPRCHCCHPQAVTVVTPSPASVTGGCHIVTPLSALHQVGSIDVIQAWFTYITPPFNLDIG